MSPSARKPNPAGDQLTSLLASWDASLALHAQYATLDDERYWHVQPWPKHERPAPWLLALARQRVAALQRIVEQRRTEGDRAFLEALDMMLFLANLVGLQNIERYIPLATRESERRDVLTAPSPSGNTSTKLKRGEEATREMPRLPASKVQRLLQQQRAGVPLKAIAAAQAVAKRDTKRLDRPAKAALNAVARNGVDGLERHESLVIEDAVRLVGWGRKWHELGELIPRLAGRPSPSETRRILRQHRAVIERQLGARTD
jgi:hypothetical protein